MVDATRPRGRATTTPESNQQPVQRNTKPSASQLEERAIRTYEEGYKFLQAAISFAKETRTSRAEAEAKVSGHGAGNQGSSRKRSPSSLCTTVPRYTVWIVEGHSYIRCSFSTLAFSNSACWLQTRTNSFQRWPIPLMVCTTGKIKHKEKRDSLAAPLSFTLLVRKNK